MRLHASLIALVLNVAAAEEVHDHDHEPDPDHTVGTEPGASPHHPALDRHQEDHDWFHLQPHLSVGMAAGGFFSGDDIGALPGAHAPIDDGFTLQGIEAGVIVELGSSLSLQANYNVFWNSLEKWDSEWEEAFATLTLAEGIDLNAGQFLTPFGYENGFHLHDRDFVEAPMSVIRLLGEEGLYVQGADLEFDIPNSRDAVLRVGYGQSRPHNHGSHAGHLDEDHEGEHEDEDEDHDDHEDHEEAGHGGIYEADEAYLDDGFFFARLESKVPEGYGLDHVGVSLAAGQNGFKRSTWIVGTHASGSSEFRQRPVWWRAEAYYSHADTYDSLGLPGDFEQSGIYAALGYEFAEDWTLASRLEWTSGSDAAGLDRRWRSSTNIDRLIHLASNADMHARLQYSYDDLGDGGSDHSIWLQLIFNFGAADHGHDH